jgi:multiphosphoryl transfer protein
MVGIVVVSHSQRLAEAAVELSLQMVRGAPPPIEVAAGLDDHVLGTDAARVKEAIDRVASPEGVLVLMDLGSAVLSAELALELRGDAGNCPVVLSDAPLVEGLVAAVTLAAAGASLQEVAGDAANAGRIKSTLLGIDQEQRAAPSISGANAPVATIELAVHNEHGLHARPAARLVETARRFDAHVTVRNLSKGGEPIDGRSVSALSTLGVLPGHHIEVSATGRQAREVLAALSALVGRNFDEAVAPGRAPEAETVAGPRGVSPGIGIGPKTRLASAAGGESTPVLTPTGHTAGERLQAALDAARVELTSIRQRVARTAGEPAAQIFDAHALLLDDEELTGRAFDLLAGSKADNPEAAWQISVAQLADRFTALPDPYQQARAQDVRDVGNRVLSFLQGGTGTPACSPSGVLVVADLTPAQAAGLDPAKVTAVVAVHGTAVSHGVILARSLGIPMVVGAGEELLALPEGTTLLVDGTAGVVVVNPDAAARAKYEHEAGQQAVRAESLLRQAGRPVLTTDGQPVEVVANIASESDAAEAVQHGADGIGLLRTEFLFLGRPDPPEEEEQHQAYVAIARAVGGRRLTIRTLDAGGDKPVSYLPAPAEDNPFLGRRGLRLSLRHPEVFEPQLRAIVRTGLQFPVTVLFPMVTTIAELRAARTLLAKAAAEVGCPPGQLPPGFEVGAMAEVPAFALRSRAASPLVDVISIGSNDLTQYSVAAERGNPDVNSLADPLDPGILALIAAVCRGVSGNTRVAVCGEVASDPRAAVLLVGLGARELSMTPRAIPEVKDRLRHTSATDAKRLAGLAVQRDSAESVRALLSDLN